MELKNGSCSRCSNEDIPLANSRLKIGICCYSKYLQERKARRDARKGIVGSSPDFKKKERWKSKKPQKAIQKMTPKLKRETVLYQKAKLEFLNKPENKQCAVFPHMKATQVHHRKKRRGFADEEARDQGLRLLYDPRFFLAVSMDGHRKIEENPEWALEMGYSLTTTDVIWK